MQCEGFVGVQLKRDPARIPDSEPEHTGEHQPYITTRQSSLCTQGARLGVGEPPRAGEDSTVECGAWRKALPDRAEFDLL